MNQERQEKERRKSKSIQSLIVGKIPAQAKELEAAVLGACMIDKDAFNIVVEFIKPETFYSEANARIFTAMCELAQRSMPIDILTVVQQLKTFETLDLIGGAHYVVKLTNGIMSGANIETHARIILEKFLKRELGRIGHDISMESYEDSTDAFEMLDEADKRITELTTGNLKKTYSTMDKNVVKSIKKIEELRVMDRHITGIPSGFAEIDQLTHGWQDTDLIILAARPAVGKTALALNITTHAATNNLKNVPVAFFSLEMKTEQLVNRMLSAESGIKIEKISTGQMSEEDMKVLYAKGAERLMHAPIFIDDSNSVTIAEIKRKSRNLKRKENIGLIVIDYLQLMSGDGKSGNREQEISKISRELKGLGKELNVPIIALSQLSRETEKRSGDKKMPQLSDLRESGAIEQDADSVMFIYRPEYYDISATEFGESNAGETHIKFAKNRHGGLGVIKLRADLSIQKFFDVDNSFYSSAKPAGDNWKPISQVIDFSQSKKEQDLEC